MSRRLEGDPVQATHHESTSSWLLRHKYSEGKWVRQSVCGRICSFMLARLPTLNHK